jgi:hypothetical protein
MKNTSKKQLYLFMDNASLWQKQCARTKEQLLDQLALLLLSCIQEPKITNKEDSPCQKK